ncbi:MAG: class I SAM-dependent methyltransferase [Cyclobacteriaceae bacterium]
MAVAYDKHYQTENLFGKPYPELISFFSKIPTRGILLDLGCGQGRDALPLARMGYEVTGIDYSTVGIRQMERIAKREGLKLTGIVRDIYEMKNFSNFDFILLDSMFHFRKPELKKESELIVRIIKTSTEGTIIVFCIQNSGKKIEIFNNTIKHLEFDERITELRLTYRYVDDESSTHSETEYKMIALRK